MTPTLSPWPSPLPGPAWHSWRQAWDHIEQRTLDGVPEDVQMAVLRAPQVYAACERMSGFAAIGDVTGVQHTAEEWLTLVKQALAAQRQEVA